MTITQGNVVKNLVLCSLSKPSQPIVNTQLHPPRYLEENIRSPPSLEEALEFKNKTEDDVINNFINRLIFMNNPTLNVLKTFLYNEGQGYPSRDANNQHIPTTVVYNSRSTEIEPIEILNISGNLDNHQQ